MFEKLFTPEVKSTLVAAAFRDISGMLQQSAKMFDVSLAALLDNDDLEVDLEDMDDVVDEGERMVRRTILEHLSVNPQQDLVASLVLASMVQDAERIGDFARGLAELLPMAKSRREGPFADELRALAGRTRPQFEVTEKAFVDDDVELARQVIGEPRRAQTRFDGLHRATRRERLEPRHGDRLRDRGPNPPPHFRAPRQHRPPPSCNRTTGFVTATRTYRVAQ